MLISRKLNHKVRQELQKIVSAIELGQSKQALVHIFDLAQLLNAHLESPADEKERAKRDSEE